MPVSLIARLEALQQSLVVADLLSTRLIGEALAALQTGERNPTLAFEMGLLADRLASLTEDERNLLAHAGRALLMRQTLIGKERQPIKARQ